MEKDKSGYNSLTMHADFQMVKDVDVKKKWNNTNIRK